MAYNMRLIAHVACGCAALSLSLLTIGFATPGWLVVRVTPKDTSIWNFNHKDRELTVYVSVFFARFCTNQLCVMTSIQDGMAKSEQNMVHKHLSRGLSWNIEIQVESVITLFCGLVGLVLLITFNRTKATKKGLGIAGLFCHLVSANLVTVLILKMAAINGQMEMYEDNELHFEVWTPYSIAIIGAGGLMSYFTSLFCIVMVCVQQSKNVPIVVEEEDMQGNNQHPNGNCVRSNSNGYSVILQDFHTCSTIPESSTTESLR
ncbi:uncharacterized protein LOC110443197 [Mizuhopecten yessoensis]|uniref:Uncharacterized protein n=1 Tax=Mizuhopecten yessoensis TaxID=6573 RepID=A0A210PFF2_MIZYE|nr:uncharacterized protein LOC110443197 [Mizuhopecten yessoensis]OWF35220.1 hypothetical protein KP79_PYT05971 [Mizuhopecten yessoensis]